MDEEPTLERAVHMQVYELLSLIPLTESGDAREEVHRIISGHIAAAGGTIMATREFARQRLAYPIGPHTAGEYDLVEFTAPTTGVAAIARELSLEPRILRSMITLKRAKVRAIGAEVEAMERALEERDRAAAVKRSAAQQPTATASANAQPESIENLDAKLEEILGKDMV
ncbi:MAG: 30S ribosomal protein S6 [bacterium]|nr:30S ribosomal protein S6 [bacterium]